MAIREIIFIPDPVLRRKAHKVTDFGKDFQTLVDDMIETLRDAPGVGLAAPQINVSSRLIIVEYAEEDEDGNQEKPKKLYVVANPEIVKASDDTEMGTEACLSVPGIVGDVERSIQIVIRGENRHGKPQRIKASGWMARIFQHEIDHVNGVIFTDRAVRVWKPKADEESILLAD